MNYHCFTLSKTTEEGDRPPESIRGEVRGGQNKWHTLFGGSNLNPPKQVEAVRGSNLNPPEQGQTVRGSTLNPPEQRETVRGNNLNPPEQGQTVRGSNLNPPEHNFFGSGEKKIISPRTTPGFPELVPGGFRGSVTLLTTVRISEIQCEGNF